MSLNFFSRAGITALICSLSLASAVAQQGNGVGLNRYVPGRLLVKFRAGVTENEKQVALASVGGRSTRQIEKLGLHVITLPQGTNETNLKGILKGHRQVEFAELDQILPPAEVRPNDPMFGSEWHLTRISAPMAWETTKGSTAITIAILDTGVDSTHPDLAPKIVPGWNFYDNSSNTSDVNGHGTQVAGAAAAASDNGVGVASPAWNCRIMPIRISDASGNGNILSITEGLMWAADHGARVANISYMVTNSESLWTAAKYFQNMGGVVTVSAGNYSTFDTGTDNPYVLTVSATDPNDALYYWSNTGNNIDIAAPGCVYTTLKGGGYGSVCGTSFSAPVTAGVAALVLSANPVLTGVNARRIMQQGADDRGTPGWDTVYGAGRVNAAKAVSLAGGSTIAPPDTVAPTVSFTSPGNGLTVSGTTSVLVSAQDNVGVTSVRVSLDGTLLCSASSCSWNTVTAANGAHSLTVVASDAAGNTATACVNVTVNNVVVPDATPPAISIVSPYSGYKITGNGNIQVAVSATDNVKVTKVELWVDGNLTSTSSTAPFTTTWNAKRTFSGTHTLQCRAYDAAGNIGYSQPVSVTK